MIAPGVRIGRYELGERLGRGSFGDVYRARDVELGREVAIKVLKPELLSQPEVVQRFLQEARAAAKIDHPGIVTVYECGTIANTGTRADGNTFIAMQLLRGESLSARIKQQGRCSIPQAITIGRQLAAALAVAHAAGIVHRDLKPDNVFLVPDAAVNGGLRVKILDFGIAKLAEPRDRGVHTHSQMILGTPRYMSPEQARSSANVDHRADIYTVGGLLFEMLVGRPVYDGDIGELIIQHQSAPVPLVRDTVPEVPAALDQLIQAMLAKEPDERPQSMLEVEDRLAAVDAGPVAVPSSARLATIDHEVKDTAATLAPTIVRRPPVRGVRMFVVVGVTVAALAAGVTWFFLHDSRPASTAKVASDAALPAGSAAREDPATAIRRACNDLIARRRWDELLGCSDRLGTFDPRAAAELRRTAEDEATNETQMRRMVIAIAEHRLDDANTLVKRIPDESVYKSEARRQLEEARARLRAEPRDASAQRSPN